MLKHLSYFSDEQLRYFLARIREINGLGDEAAFIETDKLVSEVRAAPIIAFKQAEDDKESARKGVVEELRELNVELTSTKNKLKRKSRFTVWEAERLRETLDDLGIEWDVDLFNEFAGQVNKTKQRGEQIAYDVEVAAHLQNVENVLNQPVHNVASVQRIIRELKQSSDMLTKHNLLTDDLSARIRAGLERAAWHRAKKKVAEAEVAKAGLNKDKSQKLIAEAVTLLVQDWDVAFSGEQSPQIEV